MNVLVTGGCGFIGSNFIRYILDRWENACVVNLDSLTYSGNRRNLADLEGLHGGTRYSLIHGDICDRSLVESIIDGSHPVVHDMLQGAQPNFVLNFAAETHVDRSIEDASSFIRTNILGTSVLLSVLQSQWNESQNPQRSNASGQARRLFLQVSTDEVYGCLGEDGSFNESSPLQPNSPYAASKASADLLVRAYYETYQLPAIITRSCNNYGPFQFPEKFIPLMVEKALTDSPLPVYGDGRNVREWIHVDDHCAAIACVLERGQAGRVYNVGSGEERRNIDVAESILQLLDKPKSLISFVEDRPGHDWRYSVECEPISQLGWRAEVPFERGLRETIHWYKEKIASVDESQQKTVNNSGGGQR